MNATCNSQRHLPRISFAHCIASAATIALCAVGLLCTTGRPVLAERGTPASADQAQSGTPQLRLRIAVDQFKWNETREDYTLPRDLKEGMQALLIEQLQQSGHFQVMEREATARAQAKDEDEIDRQKREALPEGSAAASARPRQSRTPAQFIITPTVTGLQATGKGDNGVDFGPLHIGGRKAQTTLAINIRISDAETSETLDTVTAEGKLDGKAQEIGINLGGIRFGKSDEKKTGLSKAVSAILNDAVTKIVARLAKEPWYALVAGQDTNTHRVILAAGSESGIAVGMEFVINKTGEPIRHPETGDIISRGDETPIGTVRVVRVERGVAFAEVISGSGFHSGNMARKSP